MDVKTTEKREHFRILKDCMHMIYLGEVINITNGNGITKSYQINEIKK